MDHLAIMAQPAAEHVAFGWFDLAWPDIAFWIAVLVVFFLFSWARIPRAMEASARARRDEPDQ